MSRPINERKLATTIYCFWASKAFIGSNAGASSGTGVAFIRIEWTQYRKLYKSPDITRDRMGFPPEKEAAKSTLLLIAMLLGGCIPSHSFAGPGTRSSPAMQGIDDWIEHNPCGVLHFTEQVVNITGRIVVGQTLSPGVTLFIAPNMTEEGARYVLNHCRFIMRQRLLWKGQFSLNELPVGQYFLAADTDNASGVVIKSLIIHRTTDTSFEIAWTRRLGEYEVMAFRITHNEIDTNEFGSWSS